MKNEHFIKYERLPGKKLLNYFSSSSLWICDTHLLHAYTQGYTENYRRFYFSDIESIQIIRTKRGLIINTVLVLLALITFGIFIKLPAGFVIPGIFIILIIINTVRGPTCKFFIRTPLHTEKIPCLSRLKDVDKNMHIIRQMIRRFQNTADFEENLTVEKTLTKKKKIPPNKPPLKVKNLIKTGYDTVIYKILLVLLLSKSLLIFIYLNLHNSLDYLLALIYLVMFAGIICAIISLVKLYQQKIKRNLIYHSWITLFYYMLLIVGNYILFLKTVISSTHKNISTTNQYVFYANFFSIFRSNNEYVYPVLFGTAVISLILGLTGTILLRALKKPF